MGFNFAAAEKAALKDLSNNKLGLMILGQSGGGKSSLLGTFGVKTLYLYGAGESHGPSAAKKFGGADVIAVSWSYDDEGNKLSPDAAYKRLLDALSDIEGLTAAGFGAVVVDGATELEQAIRATKKFEQGCLTDKGKHNNFAEGDVTKAMFRPILDALRTAQRETGIHYAMTCILDVRLIGDNGEITEAAPKLSGYAVAENLIQQFPDIIAIGRMSKNDKIAHRIQFLAGVSRTSKDASGTVKKTINFNPRLTGRSVDELPATLDADLSKLAELKAGGK